MRDYCQARLALGCDVHAVALGVAKRREHRLPSVRKRELRLKAYAPMHVGAEQVAGEVERTDPGIASAYHGAPAFVEERGQLGVHRLLDRVVRNAKLLVEELGVVIAVQPCQVPVS